MATIIIWYLTGCTANYVGLYIALSSHGYNVEDRREALAILSLLSWPVILSLACVWLYDLIVHLYAGVLFWWKCRKISRKINHQRKQLQTLKENIARHKSALQQLQDDKTE